MIAGLGLEVLQFRHMGEAYEALQSFSQPPGSFDLIPSAQGTLLLISLPSEMPPEARVKALRRRWIPVVSEPLADAFLGLVNPSVAQGLSIFEGPFVDDVFVAASRFEGAGGQVFDFRIHRGADLGAYVLAVGGKITNDLCAGLEGKLTVLSAPNATVQELFALEMKD